MKKDLNGDNQNDKDQNAGDYSTPGNARNTGDNNPKGAGADRDNPSHMIPMPDGDAMPAELELTDKMIRHVIMTFVLGIERQWGSDNAGSALDDVMEWGKRICGYILGEVQKEPEEDGEGGEEDDDMGQGVQGDDGLVNEIKSKRIKIHGSGIEIDYKPTHFLLGLGLVMFMGYTDDPESTEYVFVNEKGLFDTWGLEFITLEDFLSPDYRKMVEDRVEAWNKGDDG
jgi:hypothetical protein